MCASALKKGLKRPPCKSVCVCRFARVFRAETKNAEIRVCVLVTRPLRGLAVKRFRGMPPTWVSRPGRPGHCEIKDLSVPRMLQTLGDDSVGKLHGSIKQGRRHAAKRFYSEAAKQPSCYFLAFVEYPPRTGNVCVCVLPVQAEKHV